MATKKPASSKDTYIVKTKVDDYTKEQYRDKQMAQLQEEIKNYELEYGSLTGDYLAPNTIDELNIKQGTLTSASIKEASILSASIGNAAIQNAHLGTAVIESVNIKDGQINKIHIANEAVDSSKITNASITDAKIDRLSADKFILKSGDIGAAVIQTAHIGLAAIDTANIKDAAIQNAHLGTAIVGAANIQLLSVEAGHIKDLSIDNTKIKKATITDAEISNASITDAKIDRLSADKFILQSGDIGEAVIKNAHIGIAEIDTANIKALAVKRATIDDGAVGSLQIANASIADGHIDSLSATKIVAGTLSTAYVTVAGLGSKLTISGNRLQVFDNQATPIERVSIGDVNNDGTLYGLRVRSANGLTVLYDENGVYNEGITNGAITNLKIGTDAIDQRVIATDAIIAAHIQADAITASKIKAGEINASKIVANTITANEIAVSSITADRLSVSKLNAITADLGTVTAGLLKNATGSTQFDLTAGSLSIGNGVFAVDSAGKLTATGATINGAYTSEHSYLSGSATVTDRVTITDGGFKQEYVSSMPQEILMSKTGITIKVYDDPSKTSVNSALQINDNVIWSYSDLSGARYHDGDIYFSDSTRLRSDSTTVRKAQMELGEMDIRLTNSAFLNGISMEDGYLNIGTYDNVSYGTGNAQLYYDGVAKALILRGRDANNNVIAIDFNPDKILQEANSSPTLAGTWVSYGAPYRNPAYFKDKNNVVHIFGLVKSGTAGSTIFTLPSGYRPWATEIFQVPTSSGVTRVDVKADGTVAHNGTFSSFVSISGISFRAEN